MTDRKTKRATGDRQQATGNSEKQATGDRQQATGNGSHPEDLRRGADIARRLLAVCSPSRRPLVSARIWHPTQTLELLAGGGVRLSFACASLIPVRPSRPRAPRRSA